MFPIWFFYTLVSGACSIVFNYINRYVLKDGDDSTSYAWWFEFFRFLIFLPFCFLTFNFKFNYLTAFLFILIGVTEFISVYFYMKMHSFSELSISTTISQLRLAWVPVFAFIFLGEKLRLYEYAGIVLIFSGQIVTTLRRKMSFDKGIRFAFASSIFAAANNIVFKAASGVFAPPVITVAMAIPTLIFFPLKMKDSANRLITLGKKKWKKILLASVFNSVSMLFLIWALKFGPVGKVSAVFQSMMVLQVLVGILVLKERSNILRKLLGIAVVLAGMALLV